MKPAKVRERLRGRYPLAEVEHDAGEEARLRHTQQQAESIEVLGAGHESHQTCHQSPAQQDAADPAASTYPLKDQIAGYLKQHVAEEEDASGEAITGSGQSQVCTNPRGCEGDVYPVEIGD